MFLNALDKPGHALAHPGCWVVWFLIGVAGGCSSPGCEGKQGPARRPAESADDEAAVRSRLEAALVAKSPGYVPRTRHLNPDGSPRYTNRLILESSPYLLQHAHNPVDWFPWGDEAFERARRLGRPVFLSVGYSTCHWCHGSMAVTASSGCGRRTSFCIGEGLGPRPARSEGRALRPHLGRCRILRECAR